MKRLLGLASGLSILAFAAGGLSALTGLLIAVKAGPSAFGSQASALGLATLGSLVLDAGVAATIQRSHAQGHRDGTSGAARLSRRYLIGAITCALAIPLTLVTGPAPGLALAYAAVLAVSLATGAALRGEGRFVQASVLGLVDKSAALVAAVLLGDEFPNVALLLSYSIGTALQVLIAAAILPPARSWAAYYSRHYADDFKRGKAFLGTSVLNESQRLDVPIVQAVAGSASAGIFAAPARITALLGTPAATLSTIVYTRLSSGSPHALRDTKVAAATLAAGHSLIAVALCFVATPVTTLILGDDYAAAAPLLIVYGFAMLPAALNQLLASVLASQHRESTTVKAVSLTLPLSLILVALGGHLHGALGATAGFSLGQVTLTLLLVPKASRLLRAMATS
jgi:O-antigen/teichoic acid export membrane protein